MKFILSTILICLISAHAQAARPSAFHSDLLLLYIGIGVVLLLIIGVDYGLKKLKRK